VHRRSFSSSSAPVHRSSPANSEGSASSTDEDSASSNVVPLLSGRQPRRPGSPPPCCPWFSAERVPLRRHCPGTPAISAWLQSP
jgi:hypothetical protein